MKPIDQAMKQMDKMIAYQTKINDCVINGLNQDQIAKFTKEYMTKTNADLKKLLRIVKKVKPA